MQAYSFYLHIFSVKEETFFCIKVECSYTEADSVFRNDFIAILNTGLGCIEDWCLDAPQIRLFYLRYNVDNFLLTSIQVYPAGFTGSDITFIILIHYLNNRCFGFGVTVTHGNLVIYFSIFISNYRSCDKCPPNRNMKFVGYNHFNIPIYTGTGVPSAISIMTVIHPYSHAIIFIGVKITCNIKIKRSISRRMTSKLFAIYPILRIIIYSIEHYIAFLVCADCCRK